MQSPWQFKAMSMYIRHFIR